jgi:hypothetical protein
MDKPQKNGHSRNEVGGASLDWNPSGSRADLFFSFGRRIPVWG